MTLYRLKFIDLILQPDASFLTDTKWQEIHTMLTRTEFQRGIIRCYIGCTNRVREQDFFSHLRMLYKRNYKYIIRRKTIDNYNVGI